MEIDELQRVQNTLARVVKERSKYDHITPLLSELHWLPTEARIRHKIAVLTFKAVSKSKPNYMAELVSTHTHRQENSDPVHVGLISYMLQTSEPLSEAELFDTLLQCLPSTDTGIVRFHSKHLSIG